MSYVGKSPAFGDFPFQNITASGVAGYTLNFSVVNENGLIVFLNGVIQRPGTDYQASGTSLLFSENIAIGVQILVYGLGLQKAVIQPSGGSVGLSQLSGGVYATGPEAVAGTDNHKLITPATLAEVFGTNGTLFGNSKTANGYQKLPGGLILQWGVTAAANGITVIFPIEFPNECFNVNANSRNASGFAIVHTLNITKSSVKIQAHSSTVSGPFGWFAIGH